MVALCYRLFKLLLDGTGGFLGTDAPWPGQQNGSMGWVRGVNIPETFWEGLELNNPLQWKQRLSKKILPMGHTQKTDDALDKVISKFARFNPKPELLGRYIVGVLLGSPEFQRQ